MVEFADFNHGPMETPMTEPTLPLIELLQKQDDGDFLRAVAEAVLQLLMEHDVEALSAPAATSAATAGRPGATAIASAS